MPAPGLDVDRDAVKAHAIIHGIRPAARAFKLPESTVKSWSTREGWLKDAGKVVCVQPLPKSIQPVASNASSASEAAVLTRETMLEETRFGMAATAHKVFKRSHRMSVPNILANAQQLHSTAKLAQIAHPELRETATTGPSISFVLHAGAGPAPEAPVIDV